MHFPTTNAPASQTLVWMLANMTRADLPSDVTAEFRRRDAGIAAASIFTIVAALALCTYLLAGLSGLLP